jgi:DNA-binding response OmpR family regulator
VTARILVVDDDPDVLALVVMVLGLDGYAVVEAADPQAADALLVEAPVDLVLTDLNFGTSTSLDWVARWADRGIRVIVMTAAVAEVDVPSSLEEQATVLRKPFSLEELRTAVSRGLAS